tara:strand:+ start:14 stop:2224 length:2211 start_codon:yes stop_codon:yes gene_type:complete
VLKHIYLLLIILGLFFSRQTYLYSQDSTVDFYDPSNEVLSFFEKKAEKLISEMTIEEKASQMVHSSRPIQRLNIEKYNWWNEALHGVARSAKATVFPQAIAMAATFDTILIKNVGEAISDEARAIHNIFRQKNMKNEYTGLTFWSPNINIFRDPRWGRGHETYGEDPYLTSVIGRAFVKGMQGNDNKYLKVAACAKHFAVHSGPENERHSFNAQVSKKDLYETYLPAFKSLVDVNVDAIMCAYNRTNNNPCCGSNELIENILRESWNFKGHVVSDCGAIFDINNNHSFTNSDLESVAYAVKGGVDLNCGSMYNLIPDAIKAELLSEKDVDKSLKRLLMTRLKLGTIGNVDDNPYSNIQPDIINSKKHKNLAKEVAVKSIVLLKNKNNLLPLKKEINTLFITGPNAANTNTLLGNYHGLSSEIVTPLEGIVGQISKGTMVRYKMGVGINDKQTNRTEWSASLAGSSDATIAIMGISALMEGEEGAAISSNANGDRSGIDLPKTQINYIKTLRNKAGSKPIILVLNSGSALNLSEVEPYVDAIIYAWYLGEQGGNAIAEIIFGDSNPSGKLPFTIPRSTDQLPDYKDYSMKNRTYRYIQYIPMYPFGFGLSYSPIKFSDLNFSDDIFKIGNSMTASLQVENISDKYTEQVIQMYITQPDSNYINPKFSLKQFKRIFLGPREKKIITFLLTSQMLESFDVNGNSKLQTGTYKITIGNSSPGIRSKQLGATLLSKELDAI